MDENNIFNKIPKEIILKIIYNIDNIEDLTKIYDFSKLIKNIIDDEIEMNFNKKDCLNIYKYYDQSKDFEDGENLRNIFEECYKRKFFYIITIRNKLLESHIINYLESYDEINKYNNLEKIKKIYKKHIIYKKIINSILFCSICRSDFIESIDLYKCFNCYKYICNKCCNKCKECKECNIYEYDDYNYYHCNYCNYKCFNNMSKILKDINLENVNDFGNIKNIILDEYINRIDIDDSEVSSQHEFINSLKLTNEIKNILKKYSHELQCTIY